MFLKNPHIQKNQKFTNKVGVLNKQMCKKK